MKIPFLQYYAVYNQNSILEIFSPITPTCNDQM